MNACATDGCEGVVTSRGMCRRCYSREYMRQRVDDPEYREKLRESRSAYRRQRRADPAKHQQDRERLRQHRATPEYRERHREEERQRRIKDPGLSRRIDLKQKYNLTPDQFDAMSLAQHGCCAVCNKPPAGAGRLGLVVDHCHETGAVRGLLCIRCNTGLGNLGDTEESLLRALEYLRNNRA